MTGTRGEASEPSSRLLGDGRLDALVDRAWERSRMSFRARVARVRSKAWHLGQCAVAAGLAWWVATSILGHRAPVFAPIVAVVCLGTSYGQRLRRVAEVTVGVTVGLAVADLFLALVGSGPWQIGLIVLLAMTAALLLDTGNLLSTQAAVQSIFVVALVATSHDAVARWLDAAVGGVVALIAASIVPRAPLRRPRTEAAVVVRKIVQLLHDAAQCTRDGDIERSAEVLASARATDGLIVELRAAASEGLSVLASSPFRRGQVEQVRSVADLVTPLDRALRSTRVLARRVAVLAVREITVPRAYAVVLDDLADAAEVVARALAENAHPEIGRSALLAVARQTASLERPGLMVGVLLVELRAVVVDLLQLTGLDDEAALAALPRLPETPD
ncbi:MAG: FUSC family protein [Lapillicoccus sp.]